MCERDRFPEQRVVQQIDLPHREIIGCTPIRIDLSQLVRRQRIAFGLPFSRSTVHIESSFSRSGLPGNPVTEANARGYPEMTASASCARIAASFTGTTHTSTPLVSLLMRDIPLASLLASLFF